MLGGREIDTGLVDIFNPEAETVKVSAPRPKSFVGVVRNGEVTKLLERTAYDYQTAYKTKKKLVEPKFKNGRRGFGSRPANLKTQGETFEALCHAMVGGLRTSKNIPVGNSGQLAIQLEDLEGIINYDGIDKKLLVRPDGLGLGFGWEAKGWNDSSELYLYHRQVERYAGLQEHCPDKVFSFVMFGHAFRGINSAGSKFTEAEVSKLLVENLRYSISLPLSVIVHLYGIPDTPRIIRTSSENNNVQGIPNGYSEEHYRLVHYFFARNLLAHPFETLKKIGLNPGNYRVNRALVKGLEVPSIGAEVSEFPILVIEDENHHSWVEAYLERRSIQKEPLQLEEDDDLPF